MNSFNNIPAPAGENLAESIEERLTKRQKSTPQTLSPSPESVADKGRDEKKAKWLAGLSHQELLGVAQGAVWQSASSSSPLPRCELIQLIRQKVGGLHSKACFQCQKPGTLLECHNCPRSYHRRCVNPPIHGNYKIDGPWFCPNCKLLVADETNSECSVNEASKSTNGGVEAGVKVKVEVDDVTPLHRSLLPTGLVVELGRTRGKSPDERGKKRSRYSTLPENLDDALGLINRELEIASQNRGMFEEMERKLERVEQELKLQTGRAKLLELGTFLPDFGVRWVDDNVLGLDRLRSEGAGLVDGLKIENKQLREDIAALKAEIKKKDEEWERWRSSMKAFVDGK
jgi:hypothetical protein